MKVKGYKIKLDEMYKGSAPPFAILLRQGYEGTGYVETSYGGQAGLRLIQGKPWAVMTNG